MIIASEQVGKGHPDKIADQISDIVLQTFLEYDPSSKVACETMISSKDIIIRGEMRYRIRISFGAIKMSIEENIWAFLEELNYKKDDFIIDLGLTMQSIEIANAVIKRKDNEMGAGDQGIIFGYATNETKQYLPIPYLIATEILMKIDDSAFSAPNFDSKSQVSYDYTKKRISNVLVSIQHKKDIDMDSFKNSIKEIIFSVMDKHDLNKDFNLLINPSGSFVVGGPRSDVGLTGRKIIADTYGGFSKHGGGAFSGKDYSKVDRSAAYMLRYVAKSIVANKMADKVEIQLSYAIGIADPITMNIETFGTGKVSDEKIISFINNNFNLTPFGIKEELSLDDTSEIYYPDTAKYGHFINKGKIFPWERIKEVKSL